MLSPLHHSTSFSAYRAPAAAAPQEGAPDVGSDGDRAADKPVGDTEGKEAPKEAKRPERADQSRPKGSDGEPLDDQEMRQVDELKRRDVEVRNHEMAHVAAGGQYVKGGPTYSYQTGPDGKRYAVGGEVSISTGKEGTPEKTIAKAKVVRRAALAPAQPSGQDRAVAAAASKMEQQARVELREVKLKETQEAREEQAEKAEAAQAAREESKVAGAEGDEEAPAIGGAGGDDGSAHRVGRPEGLAPRPSHIPTAYSGATGSFGPKASAGTLVNLIA